MKDETVDRLTAINKTFYEGFAREYADKRQYIQPGIPIALQGFPAPTDKKWLNLGCGQDQIREIFLSSKFEGQYIGFDFSKNLLQIAQTAAESEKPLPFACQYEQKDLTKPDWADSLSSETFNGVVSFAVLHHIPEAALRERVFPEVYRILKPGGFFIFSVWQYQNQLKRMEKHILPWSSEIIDKNELSQSDVLLDWRHSLPENQAKSGCRYIHLYRETELQAFAIQNSFFIRKSFYSDGSNNNLALYMIFQK